MLAFWVVELFWLQLNIFDFFLCLISKFDFMSDMNILKKKKKMKVYTVSF